MKPKRNDFGEDFGEDFGDIIGYHPPRFSEDEAKRLTSGSFKDFPGAEPSEVIVPKSRFKVNDFVCVKRAGPGKALLTLLQDRGLRNLFQIVRIFERNGKVWCVLNNLTAGKLFEIEQDSLRLKVI